MVDRLTPKHPEFAKRQQRWSHNALLGHLARTRIFIRLVQEKPTTSAGAKSTALRIEELLEVLHVQLKQRIDTP